MRPTTPPIAPALSDELDALADEDLRIPAADADEAQEAVVVDVRDDQADLVDVADDGEEWRGVGGVDLPVTRATAEPMTSTDTSSVKARAASVKTAAGAVS